MEYEMTRIIRIYIDHFTALLIKFLKIGNRPIIIAEWGVYPIVFSPLFFSG